MISDELMRSWVDGFDENRIGPLFHGLIDAVVDAETALEIHAIKKVMFHLSSSINSYSERKFGTPN